MVKEAYVIMSFGMLLCYYCLVSCVSVPCSTAAAGTRSGGSCSQTEMPLYVVLCPDWIKWTGIPYFFSPSVNAEVGRGETLAKHCNRDHWRKKEHMKETILLTNNKYRFISLLFAFPCLRWRCLRNLWRLIRDHFIGKHNSVCDHHCGLRAEVQLSGSDGTDRSNICCMDNKEYTVFRGTKPLQHYIQLKITRIKTHCTYSTEDLFNWGPLTTSS